MRYKKIVSAKEAYAIATRPAKLHGGLRLFNKMILTAAHNYGCYELYMSPNYQESCFKKKKYFYRLSEFESNVIFDWDRIAYWEIYLTRYGFTYDYDWIQKIFIIKWR